MFSMLVAVTFLPIGVVGVEAIGVGGTIRVRFIGVGRSSNAVVRVGAGSAVGDGAIGVIGGVEAIVVGAIVNGAIHI